MFNDYPVTLSGGIEVNSCDELNEVLDRELQNYKQTDDQPFYKILNSALWKIGLSPTDQSLPGTINLADRRTLEFIQLFQYYRAAPYLASEADIWFRVSLILDPIYNPRLA